MFNLKTLAFCFISVLVAKHATAQYLRLSSIALYEYNDPAQDFNFTDSTIFVYNGDRGGDALKYPKFDTSFTVSPGGLNIDDWRKVNTYNSNDDIATQRWDGWDNGWVTYTLDKYTYNSNRQMVTDTTLVWNSSTSAYDYGYLMVRSYNSTNAMTNFSQYEYDKGSAAWGTMPINDSVYTYNTGGQLTNVLYRIQWNGGMLPSWRDSFTYNPAGQVYDHLNQRWDDVNSKWVGDGITRYTYNSTGNVSAAVFMRPNTSTPGLLDSLIREDFWYDGSQNLLKQSISVFDGISQTYDSLGKTIHSYNVLGQRSLSVDYAGKGWGHNHGDRKMNYYYQVHFPTAVAQLQQQGGKLSIYPVPASNTLNIDVQLDAKQACTLTIADMHGRVVMQSHEQLSQQAIDISHIPAGAYNLILQGDKGAVQHSKFTVVR